MSIFLGLLIVQLIHQIFISVCPLEIHQSVVLIKLFPVLVFVSAYLTRGVKVMQISYEIEMCIRHAIQLYGRSYYKAAN